MPRLWAYRTVVIDLLLACVVFVGTADQGSGLEYEFTGHVLTQVLPDPYRTLVAACVALAVLTRRRYPYLLLALATGAWVVMNAALGLMVATYTVSAQPRRSRWYGALMGLLAVVVPASLALDADIVATRSTVIILTVVLVAVPALLGLWIGTRRALVETLREKAERLEREQHLRADQAKAQERARIARELHDVVAHQVSLMVLHAGALEVSLADADGAKQAGLIRQTGREALEELRQVLGVLREQEQGPLLDPQPTLSDLDRVVRQSLDAKMEVSMAIDGERRPLPATVERTAYRLVQEALTNVHKHAANAATEVRLRYGQEWLEVVVRNDRPANGPVPSLALPGGGHGLLGLRERVTLLGGTFDAGPRLDGGFEVRASIPTVVPG